MCTPRQRKLCGNDNCEICFERSIYKIDYVTKNGNKWTSCLDISKNKFADFIHFSVGSPKKMWFICDVCEHEFQKTIDHMNKGSWCPYCSNQKLCSCDKCYEKSFASYQGKTKSGKLKIDCLFDSDPKRITRGSSKKYNFICDICEHIFNARISHITGSGSWCPYCANRKLCNESKCKLCYSKSVASLDLTFTWNTKKNEGVKAREICKGSDLKYWFKCNMCKHNFQTSPNGITSNRTGCPYCNSHRLCGKKSCKFCFDRSFASYEGDTCHGKLIVDCWIDSKNGKTKPINVTIASGQKYWFKCDVCDQFFETSPHGITSARNWCPYCVNKTQRRVQFFLKKEYPHLELKSESKYDWCRNPKSKRRLPFDFAFDEIKLIVEVDGEQHFRQVRDWQDPNVIIKRDRFKMKKALKKGYSVIRITQRDIFYDKKDWKNKLINSIKEYSEPCVTFIGCQEKYNSHII